MSNCGSLLLLHEESSKFEDSTQGEGDDDERQWCNGDGVCPTLPEFELCHHVSRQTWQSLAMRGPEGSVETHLDALLDFVNDVPRFCYLLEKTTKDITCDRQWRSLDYIHCLGFPSPNVFEKRTTFYPLLASFSGL
ncbi:hypothetical protein BBP40_007517 [Aspergillus hancockii]|nr:hypothetical protein BBP40_007517 [Aspergillus hancockii]